MVEVPDDLPINRILVTFDAFIIFIFENVNAALLACYNRLDLKFTSGRLRKIPWIITAQREIEINLVIRLEQGPELKYGCTVPVS